MTLKKDTKTPGGTTGFSTDVNVIHRWALDETHEGELTQCLHQVINFSNQTTKHKDLHKSHILKDEEGVSSLKSVLTETFKDENGKVIDNNFFTRIEKKLKK